MKIAIDTFILGRTFRNHGSSVYARNILEQFSKSAASSGVRFQLIVSRPDKTDATQFHVIPAFDIVESSLIAHPKLWRIAVSSFVVGRQGADMAYFPVPVNCLLSDVPSVVTVHDATVITAPSQSFFKRSFERTVIWNAMKSASRIVTVSEHSKMDLANLYRVPAERIAVVYNGVDHTYFHPSDEDQSADAKTVAGVGIQRPYLMHHGVLQPRKNLERLISAHRLILDRDHGLELDLVLAGPVGWNAERILRAASQAHPRGRVLLLGAVSDAQLASLIRRASLCVIPSLYEGFCLPVLECMACGCPTIASRSSCLPEVSGGVLLYFDPHCVEEIAESIQTALSDSELRAKLAASGSQRALEFSWERCARETLQVLTECGKQGRTN